MNFSTLWVISADIFNLLLDEIINPQTKLEKVKTIHYNKKKHRVKAKKKLLNFYNYFKNLEKNHKTIKITDKRKVLNSCHSDEQNEEESHKLWIIITNIKNWNSKHNKDYRQSTQSYTQVILTSKMRKNPAN